MMRRLLDRLLATRARRDREERLSPSWRAADEELHEIERAIFRLPLDEGLPGPERGVRVRRIPVGWRHHLRRAAGAARARAIGEQRAH